MYGVAQECDLKVNAYNSATTSPILMLLKLFQSATFQYLLQEITVHLVQNSEWNGCFKIASVKLGYFRSIIKIWRK